MYTNSKMLYNKIHVFKKKGLLYVPTMCKMCIGMRVEWMCLLNEIMVIVLGRIS